VCLLLGRVYADKDVKERIIRWSRLDWTIVRPTVLTAELRTGAHRVLVDGRERRSGFISREPRRAGDERGGLDATILFLSA
jgi:NAD(P)H-binding